MGISVVVLWSLVAAATAEAAANSAGADAWIAAHSGATGAPFSFVYGGEPSRKSIESWKCATDRQPAENGASHLTTTFSDPATGLVVRCECTQYSDFPALEWTVYFKNTGTADTPILEDVQALDTVFGGGGAYRLLYSRGSHEAPSDFEPQERNLDAAVDLAPYGGRSSDGVLPFFNLVAPDGTGVILGVGWTGQWAAKFEKSGEGVRVRAGMERTHLVLHPGEEIRTPAILLTFWSGGDSVAGNNLFRRLMLKHYTPAGARPPLAASPNGVIGFTDIAESTMVQGIRNIASHKLPIDTWWIDAGWHGPSKNWALNPGTWEPCPERFPNGLKPVGDAAHANGMRFLLWCEPERVMRDTWLYINHRDWLLAPADLPPELRYQDKDGFYLLNLGDPAALDWTKKTFSGIVRDYGLDIYRQDFNMTPLYFWRNGEPADRQGMNEIRYITGLYDLYDTLLREHPGLMIDNCASGGRRIDFEIMRRALSLFRSDCCWDPIGEQCMNYGISPWMPVTGVGAVVLDPYVFRSGMGSHMSLALDFYNKPELWEPLAATLKQYVQIRHLFTADFYPLTPYSLEKNAWIAWQYQDPEKGEGIIQAFRREGSSEDSIHVTPRGLDPDVEYAIADLDSGQSETRKGDAWMKEGIAVRISSVPGAALLHLQAATR